MRFASTLAAVAATIATAEAAKAYVYNHCSYPVYLWPVDTTRSPSAATVVAAGGSWNEDYHSPPSGGVSVKISKTSSAAKITQFEYTLASGNIWYDGSNIDCSNGADCPFTGENVLLMPSKSSCPSAACSKNNTICAAFYNQPNDNWATLACDQSADTQFHICLPDAQMPGGGSTVATAVGTAVATAVASATAVVQSATSVVAAPAATRTGRPAYLGRGGAVVARHLHHALVHGSA